MKRGQNLSIGSLILIVLGVIVLVLLVLGMSMGWGTLWEKINIFGGSNSLSDVVSACRVAVTTNSIYDYCDKFFKIKVDGEKQWVNCLDSRVQAGLSEKLSCGEGDTKTIAEKRAEDYCKEHLVGSVLKKKTDSARINGILWECGTIINQNNCKIGNDAYCEKKPLSQ